jgi:prepilin-type processing-associated H-X9-DG protein
MDEPISNHSDGINVLFADAHVDWLDLDEAKKLIANSIGAKTPLRWPATQP